MPLLEGIERELPGRVHFVVGWVCQDQGNFLAPFVDMPFMVLVAGVILEIDEKGRVVFPVVGNFGDDPAMCVCQFGCHGNMTFFNELFSNGADAGFEFIDSIEKEIGHGGRRSDGGDGYFQCIGIG